MWRSATANSGDRLGASGEPWTRRRLIGAGAGVGLGASLAACGGRGKGPSSTNSTAKATSSPKPGGQMNVPLLKDLSDFDPSGHASGDQALFEMAYDRLLDAKRAPDVKYTDLVLAPVLAQRWETPDGQTFTFHLQPGVKFADLPPVNGRALSAEDVKWSFEYLSRSGQFKNDKALPPAGAASDFAGLDSVETPDSATVVAHFSAPYAPFLENLTAVSSSMVAHEIYDQDGNFSSHVVGTGPWLLDSTATQKGSRWAFKRNPTYFQQGRPYIDEVNWLVIPDNATQYAAFRSKQVDMLGAERDSITDDDAQQLSKDNPDAVRYEHPLTTPGFLYLNVRQSPLDDVRVRRALALCIDRDEFVKVFGHGKGEWSAAGAPAGLLSEQELKQLLKYDPEQAKQLLAEAGHPQGLDIEIINPGAARGGQEEVSKIQLLVAQAKRGNINLTYHPVDIGTETQRKVSGKFQIDYSPKPTVPVDSYLVEAFYSTSHGNYAKIDDPKLDSLLMAQRQETDQTKWKQIIRQITALITNQVYGISFFYGTGYQFWRPYLKNLSLNEHGPRFIPTDTWLDK